MDGSQKLLEPFKHRPTLSAWKMLCPLSEWNDPVLENIENYLDEPDVKHRLSQLENEEKYPGEIVQDLFQLGLASLFTEDEFADKHSSRVTSYHLCALNAITARRNSSLAITLGINSLALLPAYIAADANLLKVIFNRFKNGTLASMLLTEIEHGSNLLRNQTRAERCVLNASGQFITIDSDKPFTHYRIYGEKHLINGATHHGLLFSYVRTTQRSTNEITNNPFSSRCDFSILLVERDDSIGTLPRWRTLPARGADIAGVEFLGTTVPVANRIGLEGEGFDIVQKTLFLSRGGISALASGAISGALDLAIDYAQKRNIYGSPIITLYPIADHLIHMEAMDLLCASMSMKATAIGNKLGLGAAHYATIAKYACCTLAEEAVTEGRRVLGGRALLKDYPYERLIGDVLLYGVFDGTTHVMLDQLQRRLVQATTQSQFNDINTITILKNIYATAPQRLIETSRTTNRLFLPHIHSHIAQLANLPGIVSLAPLVDLALALVEIVQKMRVTNKWSDDQGARFEVGRVYAYLETLVAFIELFDPLKRTALGMDSIYMEPTKQEYLCKYTIKWFGARIAQELRQVVLKKGIDIEVNLSEIEENLLVDIDNSLQWLRTNLVNVID